MTKNERDQFVNCVNEHLVCRKDPDGRDILDKHAVISLIIEFEPTEDAKRTDRACQPNWEAMYEEEAAKNKDLCKRIESQKIQLERAWASLRTFEFIYGRKLDGIC